MSNAANPGPKAKPPLNPKKSMIINICAVVGVVVALGVMFGSGISGAIPGALFGGIGGGLGGLVGMGLATVLVRE
jgi:hypothetical protein